jgi:chondroitin AC lyase
VHEKIFMPVMLHDPVKDSATGYVMALCPTPAAAMQLYNKPKWKVLRNDEQCQAVTFKDGTTMAAFYTAGKLEISKHVLLQTDQPCLLLLKDNKVYASDPSHKGITAQLSVNGKTFSLSLPSDGVSVSAAF